MPVARETSSNLKPNYVTKADQRFATTFISNKYRDYAVNGEAIMDKATGELFIKRPADGRVYSYFQNKKYMEDLMLNLQVMLTNNPTYTYPPETDVRAFYTSVDYDVMRMYDDKEHDIKTKNTTIPNDEVTYHKLQFRLSNHTNGFFCRLTTRDTDKAVIEYITNEYNYRLSNYSGSNSSFIVEKNKFTQIEKWRDSNAEIHYNVTIVKGSTTKTYTCLDYIHINEESCVMLPTVQIGNDFKNGYDYAIIEITSCEYTKIHFMITNKDTFGEAFTGALNSLTYPDEQILLQYISVSRYINSIDDLKLLDNEFIVALIDNPYCRRYLMKMSKLRDQSTMSLSPNRPSDDQWSTNTIWAEQIRDVFSEGFEIDRQSETNLRRLEIMLANNRIHEDPKISTESFESENIYIFDPTKTTYTKEEVDEKTAKLAAYVEEEAKKIVSDEPSSLTDHGLLLDTESIEEVEE